MTFSQSQRANRRQTWGDNPRFRFGGSFHGFYYGVVGSGGYSWDEGSKPGPRANSYSSYAGVLGTGIYVNGAALPFAPLSGHHCGPEES